MKYPLYQALLDYRQEVDVLLHMPGHKGGKGFAGWELEAAGRLDFTEVPGLDDLHKPQGVIKEAQKLAAMAWGADETLFLINGASSGIHSLFLAAGEGTKVLVPRNAHRSFLGGMIISGVCPIYIDCVFDEELGVAVGVDPEEVERKMQEQPDIAGIFLVSPTFYGTVSEIQRIKSGMGTQKFLMVDEAHGGHFVFHPDYPPASLKKGAHAVVHGWHKTLPVLTQGGALHMKTDFPLRERTRLAVDQLSSTSPSYLLMASMDLGRAIMEERGCRLLGEAMEHSEELRRFINKIPGLRCRAKEFTVFPGVVDFDPLKILVETLEYDGVEVSELLRCSYGIQVEMASEGFILAMFSPFNEAGDWRRLGKALAEVVKMTSRRKNKNPIPFPPVPKQALTPRQAFWSKKKSVNIEESQGMIAAEMVAAYPPGIPCVVPGEIISPEVRDYIAEMVGRGTPLHGLEKGDQKEILVVDL